LARKFIGMGLEIRQVFPAEGLVLAVLPPARENPAGMKAAVLTTPKNFTTGPRMLAGWIKMHRRQEKHCQTRANIERLKPKLKK
jgi:hypothetical protein